MKKAQAAVAEAAAAEAEAAAAVIAVSAASMAVRRASNGSLSQWVPPPLSPNTGRQSLATRQGTPGSPGAVSFAMGVFGDGSHHASRKMLRSSASRTSGVSNFSNGERRGT